MRIRDGLVSRVISGSEPAAWPGIRELTVPAVDKQVWSLERWLASHLASITDDGHAQLIRRFATWEVLPRLRARAERKPVTPAGRRHAAGQVKCATAFLGWLSGHDLTLPGCCQADIDAWYAGNDDYDCQAIRPFLQWCMASKLTGRFQLPRSVIRHAAPLPYHERVSQLGRVLTDRDLPLRTRAAAAIVLLYAQSLSRIVRLTLDDVIRDGDQVLLRLGEPPSPVPGPVADLLLKWIANRDNMNTATNRNSPWLFPGRRAGQPMNPDALGYHPVTTAKLAAQAAGTFSRYAPGDHLRPSSGRQPGEGDS
jgi:integrase